MAKQRHTIEHRPDDGVMRLADLHEFVQAALTAGAPMDAKVKVNVEKLWVAAEERSDHPIGQDESDR